MGKYIDVQPVFHRDLIAFVLGGGTLDSTHLDGVLNHKMPYKYWELLYSGSTDAIEKEYMEACQALEAHKETLTPDWIW